MSQVFPFTNPDPGWADGRKLYASEMIEVSRNAAQAADGLLWSDVAIAKNFGNGSTITSAGRAVFWDAYLSRWITAGSLANDPIALASVDGRDAWMSLTVPVGGGVWNVTLCGASNGAGSMVLGGSITGSSAIKLRQSSDGGDTWTSRSTSASGTESVRDLIWFPAASKFVAGLSSTATTNIETSPDAITWTQRTAPNSTARGKFAVSPTKIVCIASASSNKCIYSTDAVSWSEATLPANVVWTGVAWNERSSKFMAIGPGSIATSSDGITWSASGLTLPYPTTCEELCAYGRMWLAVGSRGSGNFLISVSIDDGVSWDPVKSVPGSAGHIATGDNQILYVNSTSAIAYATIRGGL